MIMAKHIYQLKIQLMDIKPPIWRRVMVASDTTLADLHDVIQSSMGWEGYHLHQYHIKGDFYGEPNQDLDWDDVKDESKYKLNKIFKSEKDHILYEYDFGDSWRHKVTLEKVLAFDETKALPTCVKAERACPPEDCGGVWGYEGMLETLDNPDDPEREEMIEWLGGEFDPEYVDLAEINSQLAFLGGYAKKAKELLNEAE